MTRNPYIFYHQDSFTKPTSFQFDITTDVSSVLGKKLESLSLHGSQVFEWLPFIEGVAEPVPEAQQDRSAWLTRNWPSFYSLKGSGQAQIEGLERCEYGSKVTIEIARKLFPFSEYAIN